MPGSLTQELVASVAQTRLETLQALAGALARALVPERVAEVLLAEAVPGVGARRGVVARLTADGQRLELLAVDGPVLAPRWLAPVALGEPQPLAEAARKVEPVWVRGVEDWAARWPASLGRAQALANQTFVYLPLVFAGRLLGVWGLSFDEVRGPAPGELAHLAAIADQCALALDRAQLHADAEAERRRLHALFGQAPAQIAILRGPEHRYEFVNREASAAAGDRPLLGRTVREAFPELVGSKLFRLLDRLYATGDPWVGEAVPTPLEIDGRGPTRFYNCVYQPFRDGQGAVAGIMSFAFEVTDEVRARAEAEAASQRAARLGELAKALSRALTPVAVGEVVGRALIAELDANAVALAVLDEEEQVLHVVGGATVPGRPTSEEGLRPFLDGRGRLPLEVDTPLTRPVRRGELVWVGSPIECDAEWPHLAPHRRRAATDGWAAAPLRYEGRVVGSLAIGLRRARGMTATDRLLLEAVAGHSAQAVERAQLYERAQEANRAKDEFLALLGHELRNPLAPIVTALELLGRDRPLGPTEAIIERQVRHLVRLVDDLLDVSRITRGKIELKPRRIDARAVVERAVEMMTPLFRERRHRVEVALPEGPAWVDGDEARLVQVLTNLLSNAAKYSQPGSRVRVALGRADEALRLEVQDEGDGFTPGMQARLFEPFWQGPRAPDRAEGGLGLGLSLVRSLVALHGGRVEAKSAGPGRGSTFAVTLPAAAGPPTAELVVVSASPEGTRRRVLVVDDNEDAADLLAEILGSQGLETVVVHDGLAALDLPDDTSFDAAVLDLGLPVMDGYELARRLRARWGPTVKLVALTGYGQERDRLRSAEAGFDTHLVKPVSVEHLLRALGAGPAPRN